MRLANWSLLIVSFAIAANVSAGEEFSPTDVEFFESKVRPLLVARCQECHGTNEPKAGLRLDSREAILTGGESGPAAIAGKPDGSLLVDVIGYRNSVQMPPKAKLPDAEIAVLTEWVRRGLPWPDSNPVALPSVSKTATLGFTDEQKSFWAFQPVKPSPPPEVQRRAWPRSPIDRFILAELESHDLSPAREADKRRLLRRLTIDLIGLLPSLEDVAEFLEDTSDDAFERVVDRLLASPRYAERWARHWLDVARYADSNGLDENLAYANAYRYRDYVVRAFREDKPYDRFLLEQIAGDLLEPTRPPAADESLALADASSFDPLIATGFLCLGAKMLAEDDPVKMQMDIIDEQVDTIARSIMGLTMGCARCHDHKYDPLTTEDYYGMAGIFKSTQTMDTFSVVARWHERPLATPNQIQIRDELQRLATAQKAAVEKLKRDATETILSQARQHTGSYFLAATHEIVLAERLKSAKARGNEPLAREISGAILIEAEDYVRGNVSKDREANGKGIGVLVNRGETPNFAEYDVTIGDTAPYQFELRYAAAGSRPVKIFFNGKLIKSDAASRVTGSWTPETQTWFVECIVTLAAGRNVIRLEQPEFFPHIDKLFFTPAKDMADDPNDSLDSFGLDGKAEEMEGLIPSLVQQWRKGLERSNDDPNSILAAWHQFVSKKALTPNPAYRDNGVARLLGASQPTSLRDLANRYEHLFQEAWDKWNALKATEAGPDKAELLDPVLEAARLLLVGPNGPLAVPPDIETLFASDTVTQLKVAREELAKREAVVPKYSETMAVAESKPENLKIHLRGSHLTLGKGVPRQLPRILSDEASLELPDGSGRLQLARWLVRRDHPLTSRVMANRVWQWHFGNGLVRSADNFGRLGERPTHPALLDWLANEFAGNASTIERNLNRASGVFYADQPHPRGWSLKHLHRRMIETATYRQTTEYNTKAAMSDPENRLLWRFPRQRMDVEVLRDSLLVVSGLLDETPQGTMLPTANRAYVTSTANVNPAIYNSNRRSIYLPVIRSALFEVFTAFDFADPSTLVGQRDQTTVAPQALFMMNSQFVLDQSRALAGRLLDGNGRDSPSRLRRLYNVAYSRDPSEAEVSRAIGYADQLRSALGPLNESVADREVRVWTSLCRAILAANEFVYIE